MAEVLVTIGIVTGLMGVGVLSLNRGYMNLTVAKQGLVNDLRRARMQATLKGAHFLFEASGSTYTITRLTDSDADGTWEEDPDHPAKVVDLPPGFSLSASASGAAAIAEFDGRGLLVPQADGSLGIITLIVSDDLGKSHQLQIWPSGQVEEAIQQPYQS
jgi:hypothetical protein